MKGRAAKGENFAIVFYGTPVGYARDGKLYWTYCTFPPLEINP